MAIVVCECQAGGCSRVEHRWIGTSFAALSVSTPSGWNAGGLRVRGGDTLLGCEAARSPRIVGGVWLVPPTMTVLWMVVVGVGLFLENCIVDASIL